LAKQWGASHKHQLNRISRMEGQLRGIRNMIEDQRYCIEILQQIKAVRSALKSLELDVINEHMDNCLDEAVSNKDPVTTRRMIKEIKTVLEKIE